MTFAADMLKTVVERIERLNGEKDIGEVYGEAKANGFDTKVLRKVVALRKLDKADRQEQESVLDLYLSALGMRL